MCGNRPKKRGAECRGVCGGGGGSSEALGNPKGFPAHAWPELPQPGEEPRGKMCICVCVCARARCKYESNFPVFFLPLRLRRRWPPGSGRPAPGRRLGGRARAGAGVVDGAGSGSLFHIPGVCVGEKTVGSAASASGAQAAGARRPLAGDICPGSRPGRERARCGGQAPRPGAVGARARGAAFSAIVRQQIFTGDCPGAAGEGREPASARGLKDTPGM